MSTGGPRLFHWGLLIYLALAWGLAFYLIAIALRSFPPITLVLVRLAMGALVLYLLMRLQGLRLPRDLRWWSAFSMLALLGNVLPFTLIAWGETQIPSSQAGLLMALMPISTMVLAHFFIEHERLTTSRTVGVLLGFAGVAVLMGGEALTGMAGVGAWGQTAVVIATFAYAVNTIYTKRLPPVHGLVVGAGTLIAGTLMCLPIALWFDRPWRLSTDCGSWIALVTLGVFSTGLATWVYFVVVSDCGPSFLSVINYIIPGISFAAGVLLLSEPAVWSQFLGLVAILAGIALSQPRRRAVAVPLA